MSAALRRSFASLQVPNYRLYFGGQVGEIYYQVQGNTLLGYGMSLAAAAGVNPLERPETWDLSRFTDALPVTETHPGSEETAVEGGETLADKSRPR
mgnify:CR=1 FL=1